MLFVIVSCSSEKEMFTIMTYNIRYDNPNDVENQWNNRKEFLVAQIKYNEVDLFGIQEGLQKIFPRQTSCPSAPLKRAPSLLAAV